MSSDELRKESLVKGPPCEEENCRSKFFYIRDGRYFCKRSGHLQEGRIQVEEDEFKGAAIGHSTRLEKGEKPAPLISPSEGVKLYLQSYQCLLKEQCRFLIDKKGLPAEVEAVVKELWTLRLPLLEDSLLKKTGRLDPLQPSRNYSSQASGFESDTNEVVKQALKKDAPAALDSLSLCYMAIVLLRLPMSLGDLYWWARRGEMPFLRPLSHVPKEIERRLPLRYREIMGTNSVRITVCFYRWNFELILPDLNFVPILFRYVKDLALPIDIFAIVRHLVSCDPESLSFRQLDITRSGRGNPQHPETFLISCLMIAVKLYYPFDEAKRCVHSDSSFGALCFDWEVWKDARQAFQHASRNGKAIEVGHETSVQESDAFTLSGDQIDSYLDWYDKIFVDHDSRYTSAYRGRLRDDILDMFPTKRSSAHPQPEQPSEESMEKARLQADLDRSQTVYGNLSQRTTSPERDQSTEQRDMLRIGEGYQLDQPNEELHGVKAEFYDAVADLTGHSTRIITRAVHRLERKLDTRQRREKKSYGPEEMDTESE